MWGVEEQGRVHRSHVVQRLEIVDCMYPVRRRCGCATGHCGEEGRGGLRCVRGGAAARMLFELD
eukprot:7036222-Pyramimonas_sp.AAC.1